MLMPPSSPDDQSQAKPSVQANVSPDDFVSIVSHEFRTPLTSIKGFVDTLLRYGDQLPPEQQTRFLHIIKDQADRLIRLVENVLTVSQLDSGRTALSFRAVSLKPLLERVSSTIEAKAQQEQDRYGLKYFSLLCPPNLPPVWADADKLEQVMLNLLDNAVKYSPAGATLRLEAKLTAENPDCLALCVQNPGPFIPEADSQKLFGQFARGADNPLTRQAEGTGLGLYITQALVTAMNGQITVCSQPLADDHAMALNTFMVCLPVATDERQAHYRRNLFKSPEFQASEPLA